MTYSRKQEDTKNCTSCGSPIPPGQRKSCSMCYGDISYGRDGYYQQWAEAREQEWQERDEAERRRDDERA